VSHVGDVAQPHPRPDVLLGLVGHGPLVEPGGLGGAGRGRSLGDGRCGGLLGRRGCGGRGGRLGRRVGASGRRSVLHVGGTAGDGRVLRAVRAVGTACGVVGLSRPGRFINLRRRPPGNKGR